MLRVDEHALKIVERVRNAHEEWCDTSNPFGSIFLLFAHDLVIHFSGILLQREAKSEYQDRVRFPFVTRGYARNPFHLDELSEVQTVADGSVKAKLRRLALSNVGLGHAVPIDSTNEWFIGKWINLLGSQKRFTQAFLPRRESQFQAMRAVIDDICAESEIPQGSIVWDNWLRYLNAHTTSQQPTICENGVIVGTRNHLQNRKLAMNYLQQEKEVVAVTHGEVANSVMDEPPFGYSERTLCSVLVDYGGFDKSGDFNEPWVQPRRKINRNGVLAKYVHRSARSISFKEAPRMKGLYIPTTYHGNGVYGPFHVLEDVVYREWQKCLFDSMSDLTFKAHPKSVAGIAFEAPLERRQLEDCIGEYDYLMFDYFATGAMLGLVSDRPVIYCDIGLRKLHPEFLEDLKKRCEYVKIDLENLDKSSLKVQLTGAISSQQSFSNEGIKKYVFCESSEFSWLRIFSRLHSGSEFHHD